jgi:D-alanyl-D-alanine carboxypeptidase/D-alanyl-D-alanine-endopeptidase (penicillin-binding protein 4)
VRRQLLPASLLVLAVGLGVAAAQPVAAPAAEPALPGVPAPAAPVLSPRRVPGALADVVGTARLRAALDAAVHDPSTRWPADRTCLVVSEGGQRLYEWRPTTPLTPASTQKLAVGLAALMRLGPDYRFVTEVRTAAPIAGGVVRGDLWVIGGGDPLLATAQYAAAFTRQPQVLTPIEALADRVVAAGVGRVEGRVLGDETRYDTRRFIPTWKPVYLTDFEAAPLSALTVDDGATVYSGPSLDIDAVTQAPATRGAEVLAGLLGARGVATAGTGEGVAPPGAQVVAAVESPPLTEIVGQMLRESDNTTAELLVKELGRQAGLGGSTEAGLGVVRQAMADAGLPADHVTMTDGSGLDVGNRLTCHLLAALLDREGPASATGQGLAIGAQTGTLARRFLGAPAAGRVRAKSGSIRGVSALAGFVEAERGDVLTFALVGNDVPGGATFTLQDRVVDILVRYPDAPAASALAP